MAFLITSGDVIRFQMICQIPGQISVNARDYQLVQASGGTQLDSQAVTTKFDTDAHALMLPLLSNGANWYGTTCRLMTPHTTLTPRVVNWNGNEGAGTGGAGLLPTQTAGLITLYSDYAGKKGAGRMYLPFPSPAANGVTGVPGPGYKADMFALGQFLVNNFTVTDQGVTGLFRPCLYKPGGAQPIFLYTYVARSGWATQRRRGAYGRLNAPPF